MKKIPLWKMILLSIVTLGIYQYYWLAIQKKYLKKKTKAKLPSNGWLISSVIALIVSYALVALMYIVPETELFALSVIVLTLVFTVTYGSVIWLWWTILFFRAADEILAPRVTFVWMIIHLFTLGLPIFIAQYYFNRKLNPKQKAPSKRFVTLSLVFIIGYYALAFLAVVIILIVGLSMEDANERQNRVAENAQYNELNKQTTLLDKKYTGCLDQLDVDYPTVTDETEQDYLAAYDDCEAIRIQQNKAVDERDALYDKIYNQ